MFELICIALVVAVAFLWSRLERAEKRIEALTEWVDARLSASEARGSENDGRVNALAPSPSPETPMVRETSAPPEGQIDPVPERVAQTVPEPATLAYAADADPALVSTQPPEEPPEETPAQPSGISFDFEDIFGRRLPIWAGGIALAIAGIFLVRYSIEAGLVTPLVRVIVSFAFGLGLIAGAEAAYRLEERVRDARVRQALAGAGIATLFGAFYLAGTSYGLIGPTLAFVGLAAVTAGAIAMSFRFGLPCAVLGLIGGFAAPVMVDSDSANVPLLALYLALVTGGLAWTGQKQGHRWLGYAALGVGLGWGLLMQVTGLAGSGDWIAVGGYLIVLGTVLPAFLYDRKGPGAIQIIAAGVATLQMALLVGNAGFDPLTWALYLLIAAGLAALGWRFAALRAGSAIAAFVGLWLLSLWPAPAAAAVLAVAGAMAVIFVIVPLIHQWRSQAGLVDIGQMALSALGLGVALSYQFALAPIERAVGDPQLALCLLALAVFPAASFALQWRSAGELEMRRSLLQLGSAYLLILTGLLLLSPAWLAPVITAALALLAIGLLWRRDARPLLIAAWTAIGLAALSLLATPAFEDEALRLANIGAVAEPIRAAIRWAALLLALIFMAVTRPKGASRIAADGLAALAAYGTFAQVVPGETLAWVAAIGGVAVVVWKPDRVAGWGVALAIALAWAALPVLEWTSAGIFALAGDPFFVSDAFTARDMVVRLAPAGVLAAVIALRGTELPTPARAALAAVPAGLALLTVHSGYKQIFAIASLLRFEAFGMAERTVWQALLLIAGIGIAQFAAPRFPARLANIASVSLITASLAHFAWFTLLLHNPLLTAQNVGPTPIANWLPVSYGGAIVAIVALRPRLAALAEHARIVCDIAIMTLVSLLAVSLLRQVFSGPVLTATGIGSTESLLLSLLGIGLALGFLGWGSRTGQRSWRIGSLVLMLIAVVKVFLIDAAGLEGLLRIASFMALGFSLIGIGWVYSRQLAHRPAGLAEPG